MNIHIHFENHNQLSYSFDQPFDISELPLLQGEHLTNIVWKLREIECMLVARPSQQQLSSCFI